MKKLCALILCVLIIGTVALTALAAGDTKATVTATINGTPVTEVKPGDTVKVTVNMSGTDLYSSIAFEMDTESAYFTIKTPTKNKNVLDAVNGPGAPTFYGISKTDFFASLWEDYTQEPDEETGLFPVVPVALNGDIFYYEITIKDDAPAGTFSVFKSVQIKNGANPVAFELVGDSLTIVCEHTFTGEWTPDPENPNQHIKLCDKGCGEKQTEAHSFTAKSDSEKHWEECACGAKKNEAAHTYSTPKKDATYHWNECSCGAADTKVEHTFSPDKNDTHHWEACSCGQEKDKATHSFTAKKDATYHWEECSCGQEKDKAAHTYSTPKKDATHHWNECACGAQDTKVEHTYATPKKDATHHWNECSCGAQGTKVEHTFTAKRDTEKHWEECSCGEKKGEAAHEFDWGKDANNHWGACACGEQKDVTPHTFNQEHDAAKHWEECECGEKKNEATHTFDTKKDDAKHWEECSCGEKKGEAAHTYTNWTKVDDDKHQGTCACGQPTTADHTWDEGTVTTPATCLQPGERTFTCEICQGHKTAPEIKEHTLENLESVAGGQHKGTCAECHLEYTVDHEFGEEAKFDAEKHWLECECGEKKDEAAHTFATELTRDEDGHWFACADCAAKKDYAEHSFTAKKDATNHWNECSCGQIADKAAHTMATKSDKDGHWTECACGEKTAAVKHELTYKAEGDKHFQVCACGYETEKAAHAYDEKTGVCLCGETKAKDPAKDPVKDPEQPANGDNSFVMPLVVLMVLSACGMAVTVIARKKIAR